MTPPITPAGRPTATGFAALLVGVAIVASTVLAGCGATSKSDSSSSGVAADSAKAPAPAAAGGGNADSLNQNVQAKGGPAQVPTDQLVQRSIIYTGSITLQVDDVPAAAATIAGLATGAGGFVGGDQRQLDADHSTATLTLRVPAEKFGSTLDAIGRDGREKSRSISTDDVTATVIDLDARIKTQQASVNRMRDLLAKAQSITDVATVEAELSKREADLESMQAKQRNLADLTALSTITVTLLGKDAAAPALKKPPAKGFLGGLQRGWHAFVATVNGLLLVLGALLPFLVVLGIALYAWWWLRRRRRAGAAPVPPAEPPALSPPGAA
jgi:outer membrane murein-binding lipoprotein Lpp